MKNYPTVSPKIVRAGEGECLDLHGETRHQLLDGNDTNGTLALAYSEFQLGAGSPLHIHTREDEWFWVESGTFRFQIGETIAHVKAGDFVFGPRFIPHSYTCESDGGALWIGVQEAGFENFSREVSALLEKGVIPSTATMRSIIAPYGVHFDEWHEENLSSLTLHPQIVRSHKGECLEAFSDKGRFVLTTEAIAGRFCIGEGETASFSGPPLHLHEREDELFIIRAGCYEFQIGDARVQVGPGDVVFVPGGTPHCFRVVSSELGRALVVTTPGGFDQFFRRATALFESGEVSPATIVALGEEYGIRFLPPTS